MEHTDTNTLVKVMNTKKVFLLSEDIYLFSGIKALLPNLVLVDTQTFSTEGQHLLPQYRSCFLIIDNRLPLLLVSKWLQRNCATFIHISVIVIRLNTGACFNRGYEEFEQIDADSSFNTVTHTLKNKIISLSEKKLSKEICTITAFSLTNFEKEMLNASFTQKKLHDFCLANSVTIKSLYRYRDKINARLGFDNFHESLIFLIRNNLLKGITFSDNQEKEYVQNSSRADRLSIAIMNNEIIPYYQPILNPMGDICGVEIVARWPEGYHYAISHKEFIPLAEDNGLINELTSQLMAGVIRDFSSVKHTIKNEFIISFNIGPAGLRNPVFYWECLNFLRQINNSSIKLMIEITEHQIISITPAIKELIRSLRNRGVLFALDNFGTGYANLHHLNELDLDVIKIDKTFISDIKDEKERVPMLESIIHLAGSLELRTIAGGIEHQHQKEWLINNKIDYLQGFFLLPPSPFSDLSIIRKAI